MFLNLHTHIKTDLPNERIIYNISLPEVEEEFEEFLAEIPRNVYLSVGIHPWFINEKAYTNQLDFLHQLLKNPELNQSIKFIGECGLDSVRGVSLQLQEEVFIQQIRFAEEVQKPMIIHCVKCYSELLSIKKIIRPKVPLIVHGFNQQEEIAVQLLGKEFYLSLGTAILQEKSNAAKIMQNIPLENLFFETDDKAISIEKIYEKAAEIRQISVEELTNIVFENFLNLQLMP